MKRWAVWDEKQQRMFYVYAKNPVDALEKVGVAGLMADSIKPAGRWRKNRIEE